MPKTLGLFILHSYTDVRPAEQHETMAAMFEIHSTFDLVFSRRLEKKTDYFNYLLEFWNQGYTIVNIEQDIVPTTDKISGLFLCGYPACACWYNLRGDHKSFYNIHHKGGQSFDYDSIDSWEPPLYVDGSSIGLCKFDPYVQKEVNLSAYPVDEYAWWYLDSWISQRMKEINMRWHIHDKVKHNV